jgi:RES domain-containing protein
MRTWRVTRRPYAVNPLSSCIKPLRGEGAARAGNRWNSKGVRIAYTSTSRALAILELLVHVTRETIPTDLVLIPIDVPDSLITEVTELPEGWNEYPFCAATRDLGDRWARDLTSAAVLVPSAVLRAEKNLLINPAHPEFRRVEIHAPEEHALDPRLFGLALP